MDANEFTLSLFTTRLRQLLLQYKELEKKNAELQTMIDERDARIKELDDRHGVGPEKALQTH